MRALQGNKYDEVEAILEDEPFLIHADVAGRRETPLLFAVKCGCPVKILALLLQKGAQVDGQGHDGSTALAALVICSQLESDFWQSQVSANKLFWSPVTQSMSKVPAIPLGGHISCLPLADGSEKEDYLLAAASCFLHYGAEPYWKDTKGITLVEYAEQAGRLKLAKLLEDFATWKECDLQLRLGVLPLTESLSPHVVQFLMSDIFSRDWKMSK
jgi:hypothetical protein